MINAIRQETFRKKVTTTVILGGQETVFLRLGPV